MAVPVEEAIAALSTFSLEDDEPDIQGLNVMLSVERCATNSPIVYADVSAFRLSLNEDTKSINQLNSLAQEGKEMAAILYTYRSCVKALPQLPDSMKQSQADLYMETYQVLDLEMSRLRDIQRWQASASSKLAVDMQRFSRPERRINGPTVTHLWSMIRLLDVLVALDHLKNAKASLPNDFSWYKRTFTQVSAQWQDTDSMREELDDLQIFLSTRWAILLNLHVEMFRVNNMEDILQTLVVFSIETLELDFALLFPERHTLLRVLPVLVVLATSSDKDGDSLYKRVKINRLMNIFKNDPVVPAFPDLHLSPAAILKELAQYFQKVSSQSRLLAQPSPHEIPPRETLEYQKHYLVMNQIGAIRLEHDDFAVRFASTLNQILMLKQTDSADSEWCREVKGSMYDIVVEGFQLLSRWTGRVWEQCAWKFSHPCKDVPASEHQDTSLSFSDYEKVVRWNYSMEERKALVEIVSYIKSVGSMMQRCDTVVAEALWETIHSEVQDFVQNRLAVLLKTTFRKKKDLARILTDMRTLSADWMSNSGNPDPGTQSSPQGESNGNNFHPRAVAPTTAQVHCLQFLIHELVSGGNLRKSGGLFGNSGLEIPPNELKMLQTFFYKLNFFLHIIDYSATVATLTDLGFLWFREFYLETSRVIQFPIECSLPWMLVDSVIESQDTGLLESVLIPFDIYSDSAQHALVALKQRFLYDEIEAEVDLCFDQLIFKLGENVFTYYKRCAASKLLDPSFIFASDNGDKYNVSPMRFDAILQLRRMKLLGRTIDLRSLIAQRMNKLFRENIDFLFDRFESHDICAIVELKQLMDVLQLSHSYISEVLPVDSFSLMLKEMQENVSLVSFSSRIASQILSELQNDFLPNFILCNTTQRFVRLPGRNHQPIQKAPVPLVKPNFYCGSHELNMAHQTFAQLHSGFFGLPHMLSVVKLLGSRSVPWFIRALLDLLTGKIASLEPKLTALHGFMPKSIGLLRFDNGIQGCMKFLEENLSWGSTEYKDDILHGLKEAGSIIFLLGLLDIALKEAETTQFMQIAPWLGLSYGSDGQVQLSATETGESPIVNLFKSVAAAIVSSPRCLSTPSFITLSKQAEAADLFYRNNLQTGSVLEYALAFTSAELDRFHSKWNAAPKTGFIDITTSKDFYRLFSGLHFVHLAESNHGNLNAHVLGDSVAWGGCTLIYLLGQQLQFELFDFTYQLLNVAEAECLSLSASSEKTRTVSNLQGWDNLFDSAKKARRLNNHVFSMLKARCPLEEKTACAIKQSGAPLHRVVYENTISAFETLPQKGS